MPIFKHCDLRSKIFTEKIFEKVWTEKNWCCMEMNVKLGRKLRYAPEFTWTHGL